MLVPVKWLKEYVDINNLETKELADKLTMSGSHVDSIELVDKGVEGVVVGKILEINPHPNADKLVITVIDVGEKTLQIVTGADNINEGDYIPVALHGAKLPGGIKIKRGKLRGIESQGMLCSAQELGIAEDLVPKKIKNGIFILDKEYPIGRDIKEILELYGEIIEFEITPNRPDCLSIIGMARETAATLGKELKHTKINIENEYEDIYEYMNGIEIKDEDLCNRYYGRVIKNIKVKESPMWIQRRLIESGVRPINNIVDITNYVMLEMGQPLHAFDLNKLEGKKIIVRRAKPEETIETLDGTERKLTEEMLVIADEAKPVALAGVMGGLNSEVTDITDTILIESANFDKRNIRLTSRAVGLRTEASSKYEKGLTADIAEMACNRVCQLIEMVEAGEVIAGHIDVYPKKSEEKKVNVRINKVEELLGIKITEEQMIDILERLELRCKIKDNEIEVDVPSFRQDLEIEADIIEEIGRVYGFHNIPSQPLMGSLSKGEKSRLRRIEDLVKNILVGMGLNEITTYSFISPKDFDKISLPESSFKRQYVKIMNPLGEDYSVMRTTLISNMMDVLSKNYKKGIERSWAFETGNIFIPNGVPVNSLPYEIRTLSIGMYGDVDFFDLKGIVEELGNVLGIKDIEYMPERNNNTFHPGRTATIVKGNHVLGVLGEIHPDVTENYGVKERTYVAELDLDIINLLSNLNKKHKELPKYPGMTRDISILIDDDIMVKDIEKIVWDNGDGLIEKVELFDVYKGKQVPEGKKSVAYSIKYRSYKKTLTDEEVTKVHDKIINELSQRLNAVLR